MRKVGMQTFSYVHKSQIHNFMGSFQIHKSTKTANRKCNFVMIDLRIANPQISLVFQSANYESANFYP